MRCLLQVFANQKDKSQHLYEHFILRDGDHLTGLRPAPSSGKPGDRGRSPRLVSRADAVNSCEEEFAMTTKRKCNCQCCKDCKDCGPECSCQCKGNPAKCTCSCKCCK